MTGDLVPLDGASDSEVPPAIPLPGLFQCADWRLVLAADGWYLLVGQTKQRITVDETVRKLAENPQVGKKARAPVFKATREYMHCSGRNWRTMHGSAQQRAILCTVRDSTRSCPLSRWRTRVRASRSSRGSLLTPRWPTRHKRLRGARSCAAYPRFLRPASHCSK